MISKIQARHLIEEYGRAWMQQDTTLLLSLFSEDAVYAERQYIQPYRGHDEIAQYWNEKVVSEQQDITFELHNVYVDEDTVVAEFSASAYSTVKQMTVQLESVCIFDVNTNGLITNWREFWHSAWIPE